MAVAGDPKERHGIILAKNELAKGFGVKTAEPIWQAKQKCPNLVLVPPDYPAYQAFSIAVNEIYAQYTDLAEPFGLDETFLDVTGSLHLFAQNGKQLADMIRAHVKREIGITISVGVSFTKTFAKLGSDYKKPDATTVFDKTDVIDIIYPMPVDALLMVGKRTAKQLADLGIHTIGQLAQTDPLLLQKRMGKIGAQLSRMARGQDTDPVQPFHCQPAAKSIGNGMTFRHDLTTKEELHMAAALLAESIAGRMRKEQVNCRRLQVAWKTCDFESFSRQAPCPKPTHLAADLTALAYELLASHVNLKKPVRSVTLTAGQLEPIDADRQLDLFAPAEEEQKNAKQQQLEDTLFDIRDRYGATAIHKASLGGIVTEKGPGHPRPFTKNPKENA